MKLNLKTGEHIRIQSDDGNPFMIFIESGILHITANSGITRTQLIIKDKSVQIEHASDD